MQGMEFYFYFMMECHDEVRLGGNNDTKSMNFLMQIYLPDGF